MKKKTLGSFPIFELLAQQTLFNSPNSVSVIKKNSIPSTILLHHSPVQFRIDLWHPIFGKRKSPGNSGQELPPFKRRVI